VTVVVFVVPEDTPTLNEPNAATGHPLTVP
jgi:hypothetical protein